MHRSRLAPLLGVGLGVVVYLAGVVGLAQQPTGGAPGGGAQAPVGRGQAAPPGRGATAPAGRGAPLGVAREALGDGPWVFDTAEQHKLKVVSIARGLVNPWSLVFLPDGSMLVTERPGRLRIVRNGVLDPQPIGGVPAVAAERLCGLWRSRCIRDSRRTGGSTSPIASPARRRRWPPRSRAAASTARR